jgi:hypothetical protein
MWNTSGSSNRSRFLIQKTWSEFVKLDIPEPAAFGWVFFPALVSLEVLPFPPIHPPSTCVP